MTDPDNKITFIREILAHQLGLEPEDIKDEDSFSTDLHMRASDLSDYIESLDENKIEVSKLNLREIETFADLIEALGYDEY